MRKVTNEDLNDIYYRSLLLSDKLEELEGIIDGTGTSLLPMITDESGRSSAEKVEALAAELLESFRHYRELEKGGLADWEEEMYSCFLYCAMQMYQKKRNRYDRYMTYTDIPGTFGAILDAAEGVDTGNTGFKSFHDFFANVYTVCRLSCLNKLSFGDRYSYKQKRYSVLSDFCKKGKTALDELGFNNWYDELMIFDPSQDLHAELCGKFASEHGVSDEDNEQYRRLAEDSEGYINELEEEQRKYNEAHRAEWEMEDYFADQAYEGSFEEYQDEEREMQKAKLRELGRRRSYMEYDKYEELKGCYPEDIDALWRSIDYDDQGKKLGKWREFVADKDMLQKRFARFVQLYYDHSPSDFFSNVQNMVISYLAENKLCPMAFGDDYGLVNNKLRTAVRMISNEIERVRNRV